MDRSSHQSPGMIEMQLIYHRTVLLLLLFALLLIAACSGTAPPADEPAAANTSPPPVVTVYKSPTCGCCEGWIEHIEANGFTVEAHDLTDMQSIKTEQGVPPQLQSCHTALVDGYVVEGHVPAEDISRLLAERPQVSGLAVPGMPIGSPGMEISGQPDQPFDVVTFDEAGEVEIFSSHNP